jgi:hypothetical protein
MIIVVSKKCTESPAKISHFFYFWKNVDDKFDPTLKINDRRPLKILNQKCNADCIHFQFFDEKHLRNSSSKKHDLLIL